MINQQVERLQKAYGKKKDPDGKEEDDNIEKAEVNEELFKMVYPAKEITTEADFRAGDQKRNRGVLAGTVKEPGAARNSIIVYWIIPISVFPKVF